MTARLGSMFTGVGGLDLAVTAFFDADTVWHCEDDPHAGRVLATRFPGIPNLGDVTAIDWATVPPVDVLCGGFPCQDISFAGLGGGITEGTRSGLWASMATAVRILRPRVAVLENVSAITVRGLDRVAADLAVIGYDLAWTCLRAADVGAPHRRSRWFAVAYAQDVEFQQPRRLRNMAAPLGTQPGQERNKAGDSDSVVADAEGVGRPEGRAEPDRRRIATGDSLAVADAHGVGREVGAEPDQRPQPGQPPSRRRDPERRDPAAADAENDGRERVGRTRRRRTGPPDGDPAAAWGPYWPAVARWEYVTGVAAPVATDVVGRLNPDFVEWLMGLDVGWTDVGISRAQRLKCLGNAVVPQQATAALQRLYGDVLRAAS